MVGTFYIALRFAREDIRKANRQVVEIEDNVGLHDHNLLGKYLPHDRGQLLLSHKVVKVVLKPGNNRRVSPLIDIDLDCDQTMLNTMAMQKAIHTDS